MGVKTQRFFFEAARIRFGIEHCRTITTVADVAGSLQDTYIDLNGTDPNFAEVPGYLYIGTDPALSGGKTGYEVVVASGATAAEVAAAIALTLSTVKNFRTTVSGGTINIENRFGGAVTAETDSGATGFTINVDKVGSGLDLGGTQNRG
jgi:phage tail sheath gpL-like